MTAPYVYTDPAGDVLEVIAADGAARLIAADAYDGHRTTVEVTAENIPDLVAAIYRAAGQRAPVLLNPDEVAGDWVRVTGTGGAR